MQEGVEGLLRDKTRPSRIPPLGQQSPHQRLAVNPVGLRAPPPSRRCNRCRVDDVALDLFALEDSVYPETIKSRLLDRYDRKALTGLGLRLSLQVREVTEQPWNVAARNDAPGHLFAPAGRNRRHQPFRTRQFQEDEYCGKIDADSGRGFGAVGLNADLQVVFGDLTLAEHRSLSTPIGSSG